MQFQTEDLLDLHPSDIASRISDLEGNEQTIAFLLLPFDLKAEAFAYFDPSTQAAILTRLGKEDLANVLNNLAPDDRTRLFEDFPDTLIKEAINLLDEEERKVAINLLGYPEDSVGRLMTPYYIQAKKDWTVDQTLLHIKKFGKKAETLNFIYVVDKHAHLIDDIQIGALLMAESETLISELMDGHFISLKSLMKQEHSIEVFKQYDRPALPVVTEAGVLVGIVTVDDMLDLIEQEDTEDIQKIGGMEALDMPYVETSLRTMVKKRAGWLIILFLSEMLTATAMGYFKDEIAHAVVLALFIPLIISSGGNSGSQAATLIIRSMALREIDLRSWWYVMRKEIFSGLALGGILGLIGFIRIYIWQKTGWYDYGEHWFQVASAVSCSLIGIVLWGTLSGAMVPFILRRFGLDPATSSAPFVATLVDVTGLIIYFSIAAFFLQGKLM